MFEYIVMIEFTADSKDENFNLEALQVAKYRFDLGLQVNDIIKLTDVSFLGEDEASYTCVVKRKEKSIKQHLNGDIFSIYVFVEIADKEIFEELRDILKKLRPDKF